MLIYIHHAYTVHELLHVYSIRMEGELLLNKDSHLKIVGGKYATTTNKLQSGK